jgi:hypothetical protein
MSWFDSLRHQIFREVVGLERRPLSLVSTIDELLGRKSSGSGEKTEITAVEIRRSAHATPSIRKRHQIHRQTAVAIVHSRTQATEFVL